jgi:hypothetical protein
VAFYLRKGFSFGPLRLNLSRSGLGASLGVTGARIGIKPDGSTYVHAGRAGLYYRQTLTPSSSRQPYPVPSNQNPIVGDGIQEITSADAARLVDSSAGDLLQELNRVNRRRDLFPIVAVAGVTLLPLLASFWEQWWLFVFGFVTVSFLALCSRHYDVTNGSVILNYSLNGDFARRFAELEAALKQLAMCARLWHVDASADTIDWKRNAGASSLNDRSNAELQFGCPRKVSCNIAVPTLKLRKKSLYFFPDRLVLYDSTGVGSVSYSDLQTDGGQARFIENGFVPPDATQVGKRWQYVNKNGGPDRRFSNNREYPIMLYGRLSFRTPSGLNELLQCSVPTAGDRVAQALSSYGESHANINSTGVTFATPPTGSRFAGLVLWSAVSLVIILLFLSAAYRISTASMDERTQADLRHVRENQARQEFAQSLAQRLAGKHKNLTVEVVNDELDFQFLNESQSSARREGVEPFVEQQFFKRFITPDTESDLCNLGFRALSGGRNHAPAFRYELECHNFQNNSQSAAGPR